jgi:hypothetical protein
VQRLQRGVGQRDLAPGSDPGVERRAAGAEGDLVTEEGGQPRTPPPLIGGSRTVRKAGSVSRLGGCVPQHGVGEAHRRGAVRERVVDAPHEGLVDHPRRLRRERHDVDAPERPVAVEPLGEQPGDPLAQLTDGVHLLGGHHVRANVEAVVLHRHGLLRRPRQPPLQGRRRRVDATRDRVPQRLEAGSRRAERTTLQVWPATAPLSSSRIARSSALSGMAAIKTLWAFGPGFAGT